MPWKALFYETVTHERPVQDFIRSQSTTLQTKILRLLTVLQEYGIYMRMPHAKQIANNLYELRIRGKDEIRIFFCYNQQTIYLLHVFKKKTQKTPLKEIEIAIKRRNNLTLR